MTTNTSGSDSEGNEDWNRLQTISTFDGIEDSTALQGTSHSNRVPSEALCSAVSAKPTAPVSLLVESLVQQLCTILEPNPELSSNLYITICDQLHQMNLVDETYAMGEFELMRSQYQKALYQLVCVARGQDLPSALQSVWPLTQPMGLDWSRYHREFDELEYIAGGGFGKVFKARHKLDGLVYAVKKITIKYMTTKRILTHLAEVKTLASLNHPNIVAYKAAWLEPLLQNMSDGESQQVHDPSNMSESLPTESELTDTESRCMDTDNSIAVGDDSEFVLFEDSRQQPIRPLMNFTNGGQIPFEAQLMQPHVKLKWAILFIQMTLCQVTLREWLDTRNEASNLTDFYLKFVHADRAALLNTDSAAESGNELHSRVTTDIFRQILSGLQYIHTRNIVHHDLKPSNIFVSVEHGAISIQLGDFGLACPLQGTHGEGAFGTPLYAAPEQLLGKCDPKSDIFSAGIILVELLSQFGTAMEKITIIKNARDGILPDNIAPGFKEILQSVFQPCAKRPTAFELINKLTNADTQYKSIISDLQRRLSEKDEEINELKRKVDQMNVNSAA